MGGFNATSNVLAGFLASSHNAATGVVTETLPIRGTHAHSFVCSFASLADVLDKSLVRLSPEGAPLEAVNFVDIALRHRAALGFGATDEGELAAFISYAQSYPRGLVALVDTYDVLRSGVPNFICVALALIECGYKPLGVRIDSGDLAELSKATRAMFKEVREGEGGSAAVGKGKAAEGGRRTEERSAPARLAEGGGEKSEAI